MKRIVRYAGLFAFLLSSGFALGQAESTTIITESSDPLETLVVVEVPEELPEVPLEEPPEVPLEESPPEVVVVVVSTSSSSSKIPHPKKKRDEIEQQTPRKKLISLSKLKQYLNHHTSLN